MNTCAHCGRKLLSHISARCNWCGGEIADPEYQAQAEAGRSAYFAEQAAHDLQSLSIMRAYDPLAVGMTAPAAKVQWQRHAPPPAVVPAEPEDEITERFDHLEI